MTHIINQVNESLFHKLFLITNYFLLIDLPKIKVFKIFIFFSLIFHLGTIFWMICPLNIWVTPFWPIRSQYFNWRWLDLKNLSQKNSAFSRTSFSKINAYDKQINKYKQIQTNSLQYLFEVKVVCGRKHRVWVDDDWRFILLGSPVP